MDQSPDSPVNDLDLNPRYRVLPDFGSRFLPDARNISIYLPEAYRNEPKRRFPVFYLHDGQNLFDPRTSYIPNHTWRAHSTADQLTAAGQIEPIILVGVHNTGVRRMAEYTPTRDPRLGGGEGALYGQFLIESLLPHINTGFRTLITPANTALGGSSLGGLISLALGLAHPETFGKLAILSPSIWWNGRSILTILDQAHPRPLPRIWLDMGMAEGLRHLRDTDLLHRRLINRGWRDHIDLSYHRIPNAIHTEDAWADRFGDVLRFLFPLQVAHNPQP